MPIVEDEQIREEEISPADVPEVEIRGDEASIRVPGREQVEERTVRLPNATWA